VSIEEAVRSYIRYYDDLRPETVDGIDALVAPDVRFKDPFNDVRGRDKLRAIFADMFTVLQAPRFVVRDHAVSGRTAYLRWGFDFTLRGRAYNIEGMSEVRFDEAGLVVEHIDHWDAAEQVYEHIPGLGALIRLVKRRMAH